MPNSRFPPPSSRRDGDGNVVLKTDGNHTEFSMARELSGRRDEATTNKRFTQHEKSVNVVVNGKTLESFSGFDMGKFYPPTNDT